MFISELICSTVSKIFLFTINSIRIFKTYRIPISIIPNGIIKSKSCKSLLDENMVEVTAKIPYPLKKEMIRLGWGNIWVFARSQKKNIAKKKGEIPTSTPRITSFFS